MLKILWLLLTFSHSKNCNGDGDDQEWYIIYRILVLSGKTLYILNISNSKYDISYMLWVMMIFCRVQLEDLSRQMHDEVNTKSDHTLWSSIQLKYFVSFQHFAAGFGDGEHPKEPGDREDDRWGLRHLARRQPSLCASGNPYSGSTVFMELWWCWFVRMMMIIMNDEWQVLPDKARGGARGRLSVLRHERFQMWTTIVTMLIMRIVTIIVTILIVFFCEQGSHPPVLPIQQPPNHHNKNPRWEVGWIF